MEIAKVTKKLLRLALLATLLTPLEVEGTACSVCRGGEPITKPDEPIVVETPSPFPIENCRTLDAVAAVLPADAPDCDGIQSLGAICGCPVAANACRLCPDLEAVPIPHQTLGFEDKLILQHALGGTSAVASSNITCELYDALLSSQDRDSDLCAASDPVRQTCGCPSLQSSDQTGLTMRCSVCEVRFPNNSLTENGPIPLQTCGDIMIAANSSMLNSTQCSQLQQFMKTHETSCGGCLEEPAVKQSCSICPDGFRLRNQSMLLNGTVTNSTFLQQYAQVVDDMANTDVDATTCGDVEGVVRAIPVESNACVEAQSLNEACGGCEAVEERDQGHDEARCTLCPFGEPVPFPNQTIDIDLPFPGADCATLDLAASVLTKSSPDCAALHALAKVCGCSIPAQSCSICPNSPMTRQEEKFAWFHGQGNIANIAFEGPLPLDSYFSCEILDSALATSDNDNERCFILQLRGSSCGCPHPIAVAGVVLKRIFAFMSLLGSLYILQSVLRVKRKYTSTYHQLVLAISFFDLFNSTSFAMGPTSIPAYSGIQGAMGNMTTCKVAAFFVQLSITSAYFNLGLAVYFWLVICHNKTEEFFARFRMKFYVVVSCVGLGHALGGIPYYTFGVNTCHVFPPPIAKTWYPAIVFLMVPVFIVLAGTTVFTLLVLMEVHRRERASVRYRSEQKKNYYWTRRVFWKSLLYLGAFYPTYPVLIVAFFVDINARTAWLMLLVSALTPSQGFWNFVVYYTYNHQRSTEGRGMASQRGSTSFDQGGYPQELPVSSAIIRTEPFANGFEAAADTPAYLAEDAKTDDEMDEEQIGVATET